MQINITGPRGCGKTTAAIEIAKFLWERGCAVRIVGHNEEHTRFLEEQFLEPSDPDCMNKPLPVVILDSFETHDEMDIRNIVTQPKIQLEEDKMVWYR